MPKFKKKSQISFSPAQLYLELLLPRSIEERMLKLLRQNKIAKWFSGMGQEAIAVGATLSLNPSDVILPMHRNLGVFTARRVNFYALFCQLFGKKDGFTQGRERSFHFGIPDYHIIGMISHLGAMLPVADGIALAAKLRNEDRIVLSFSGDGGVSEGDFHEAVNLAAVWKLPVIFLIENNGYGLSTPTSEQYACNHLVDRALGYGIKGIQVDGNDLFAVMDTFTKARSEVLSTGMPVLIEAMTFRMRGHEEASGTAYVPQDLIELWAEKDPIKRLGDHFIAEGLLSASDLIEIRTQAEALFTPDLERALLSDEAYEEAESLQARVYVATPPPQTQPNPLERTEARYLDGIQWALRQAMDENPQLILMGQDIAEYGGVFKITEGFIDRYGKDRVRNTPIIESGAIGAAMGLALEGFPTVVEMQFADFVSCGYNQIVNNLAKTTFRWSPALPVTIRLPYGGGVGAGPYHSQCPEGWFMQHPGLKIAVPATAEDALLLTYAALIDPNPVLIFEHKKLYRSIKNQIPTQAWYEPLGKAKRILEGQDATIITYGLGVYWALEAAAQIKKDRNQTVEVIDLRTLVPFDLETVLSSLKKTNKVLLLHEATLTAGPASEWAALIVEYGFEWLDAPVMRCASLDMPVPTATALEQTFLAQSRLMNRLTQLLSY